MILNELRYRVDNERLWDWKPSQPPDNDQQAAYYSKADEVWAFGGNRSGKSELVCAVMAQFAQGVHPIRSEKQKPPVFIRHCAPSWEDNIQDVLIKKYQRLIPRAWLKGGSWSDAITRGGRFIVFSNGSKISFKSSEQKLNKWGGDDLDAVGQDEHIPESYYLENRMRLADRDGFFMAAMTPELGITWEEDHVLEPPERVSIEHYFFDTEHNPHLSEVGVAKVKATIKDPRLAEAKLHGRFVPLSGLVIPQFNYDISVIPDRNLHPDAFRVFCIDLHIKTPSAAMWAAWEPDGTLVVYRTAKKAFTVPEWKAFIRAKSTDGTPQMWLADETERETGVKGVYGQDSIVTAFNQGEDRLPLTQVEKGANSFEAGIYRLWSMFKPDLITRRAKIEIFKSCDYGTEYIGGKVHGSLIWELRRYQYKTEQKGDEETLREKVRKINDHYIDDVRYIAMAGPRMQIEHTDPIIVRSVMPELNRG